MKTSHAGAVAIAAMASVAFALRASAFLAVTPGHDFVGDVVWAEALHIALRSGHGFPDVFPEVLLGAPSTVQRGSVLLFLPVALLAFAIPLLSAAKAWFLALHASSALGAVWLARTCTRRAWLVALAAAVYLLAPIHGDEISRAGHWQLAVSFALAPWALGLLLRLGRRRVGRTPIALGLVVGAWLLSDNERALAFVPVAAVVTVWLASRRNLRVAALAKRVACAVGVASAVTAWALVPLWKERDALALTRIAELFPSRGVTLWVAPSFLVDGVPAVPAGVTAARGVALGLAVTLSLAAAVITAAVGARRTLALPVAGSALVALACTVAPSPLEVASAIHGAAAWAALPALALGAVTALVRSARRGALVFACTAAISLVPARALLAHVPAFSAIGNAVWFVAVNAPLLATLAVATAVGSLGRRWHRFAAAALVTTALLVDVALRPFGQSVTAPESIAAAEPAFQAIRADGARGRSLRYPYVESDAAAAYVDRRSPVPSAGGWLVWAGARGAAEELAHAYATLDAAVRDPARAGAAADVLARLHVRYVLVPARSSELAALGAAGPFRDLGGGDVHALCNERDPGRFEARSSTGEVAHVTEPAGGTLVFTAPGAGEWELPVAAYPHYRVTPGDAHVAAPTGGLLRVHTARAGEVTVLYTRPWWHTALSVASGAALFAALSSLRPRRRRSAPASRG